MQTFFNLVMVVFFMHALFLQSVWLYLGRIARNQYLADIMSFRTPSSRLSRYYEWRVRRFENALVEGAIFLILLVGSLYAIGFSLFPISDVNDAFPIVLFVVFLSLISALQHAWRVKEVVDAEGRIVTAIKTSTDKVGVAKMMVDDLYLQGAMGDGRTWFALFKIAQKQDQVGWVIRDVLIEKGREEDARFQRQSSPPSSKESSTEREGPGIN
jgi:hypothetical protein